MFDFASVLQSRYRHSWIGFAFVGHEAVLWRPHRMRLQAIRGRGQKAIRELLLDFVNMDRLGILPAGNESFENRASRGRS